MKLPKSCKKPASPPPCAHHRRRFLRPHFQERGIFLNVTHPIAGDLTLYDLPWQASGLGRKAAGPAPTLGENNDYVFGDILGLSKDEIAKLQEEQVIY